MKNEEITIFNIMVKAIIGTPIWVWFIFIYLLFIGIKGLKKRTVYLPKLYIIPIIFSAIKYKIFLEANLQTWLVYFIGVFIAVFLGNKLASKEKIEIYSNMKIELPGNIQFLIILMFFFCIKYIFGYLHATDKVLSKQLVNWEITISSLLTGYFLGKALNYSYRYLIKKRQ